MPQEEIHFSDVFISIMVVQTVFLTLFFLLDRHHYISMFQTEKAER